MKKVLIKTTIFLLIAVMAFALTGCDELFQVERTEQLPKFKDFNALLEYMQKMPQGYMYGMRGGMAEESAAMDDATAPGAKNEAQGDGQSHGETNVQVAGIDEADVIKNDGRYLYFVAGNRLVIVDAIDPANMTVAGRIVLDDMSSFSEMFITGNRLTAIGYSYEENTVNKENNEKKVAPGYIIPGRSFTFAKVYDITDRSNPVMTREFKIEGSPLSTRVKDNKLYLVTNKWAYFYGAEGVQPRAEDILPVKYDSKAGKDSTMINPGEIAYLPNPVDNSFMTISVMEINGNQAVKTETVMGGGSTVYMSHNALYIVKPAMYFFPLLETAVSVDESAEGSATSEEAPAVAQPTKPPEPKTAIYKYDLTGNTVKYAGTGEVKGDVLNQFSMDEFNGFFRIATTDWGRGESNNNVYILDSNMKNVGAVKNLAPGERIYSVRFSGNTGYVVTFRNMDPLFVLDLSNPSNPKVLGELKIPGFSNYLHPVGDGLLLGLGVDTQEIYMKDDTGTEYLILFTSPERATEFIKDFPGYGDGGLLAEFTWIMEKMGVGFGISLNPDWPVGIDLEPEIVKQLTGANP